MRLQGKKIVITGAGGISAAAARLAAAEGAHVFVISMNEQECRTLTDGIERSDYAVADLTAESQTVAAFETAKGHLGTVDGVFAVAGGSGRRHGDGPLDEMSLDAWLKTFQMNGDPMFLTAREAVRTMQDRGGSLVLVGSVLATSPVPTRFATHAYASVKGAAISLARTLASYYAPQGIRVNVVAPGLVATPMSARAAQDPDIMDYAAKKQPLAGGMIDPDDVARAALFLLSDDSSRITGQVLDVDGGWSVTEA
ncbi:MAG TPA: SDR family oxidoreductase [Acidimicrobiia bacterium]|nr:SDR family oxidoreductase [Acidimicrobiia bacterium]